MSEFQDFLRAFAGCRYWQNIMYVSEAYNSILSKSAAEAETFKQDLTKFASKANEEPNTKDDLAACVYGIWKETFDNGKRQMLNIN